MSRDDVFPFEMSYLQTPDPEVERILRGKEPIGQTHEHLFLLVKELQSAYPMEPIPEETERVHLAAMLQAACLTSDEGEPAAEPDSKATGPAKQVSRLPKTRRRLMLSELFASVSVKVAAYALAGLTAFGGVAAAGALPDPAQSAVAGAAAYAGVELPNPANELEAEAEAAEAAQEAAEEKAEAAQEAAQEKAEAAQEAAEEKGQAGEEGADAAGGAAATGAPAVPDHVELPEDATVPTTVPVRTGAPDSVSAPSSKSVPVPEQASVPDKANIPDEVPVRNGAPDSSSARTAQSAPAPEEVPLPEQAGARANTPAKAKAQ